MYKLICSQKNFNWIRRILILIGTFLKHIDFQKFFRNTFLGVAIQIFPFSTKPFKIYICVMWNVMWKYWFSHFFKWGKYSIACVNLKLVGQSLKMIASLCYLCPGSLTHIHRENKVCDVMMFFVIAIIPESNNKTIHVFWSIPISLTIMHICTIPLVPTPHNCGSLLAWWYLPVKSYLSCYLPPKVSWALSWNLWWCWGKQKWATYSECSSLRADSSYQDLGLWSCLSNCEDDCGGSCVGIFLKCCGWFYLSRFPDNRPASGFPLQH